MGLFRKVRRFLRMLREPVFRDPSTHPTKATRRSAKHGAMRSAGIYPGGKWYKGGRSHFPPEGGAR